jgi:hypothetical protein
MYSQRSQPYVNKTIEDAYSIKKSNQTVLSKPLRKAQLVAEAAALILYDNADCQTA